MQTSFVLPDVISYSNWPPKVKRSIGLAGGCVRFCNHVFCYDPVVAACSEANGRAVLCMCTLRNGQTECDSIPVRKAWPSARVRKQPSGARHWSRSALTLTSIRRCRPSPRESCFEQPRVLKAYVATKFPTCRLTCCDTSAA